MRSWRIISADELQSCRADAALFCRVVVLRVDVQHGWRRDSAGGLLFALVLVVLVCALATAYIHRVKSR